MLKLEFFSLSNHQTLLGCQSVRSELIFRLSNFDKINLINLGWRIVYSY